MGGRSPKITCLKNDRDSSEKQNHKLKDTCKLVTCNQPHWSIFYYYFSSKGLSGEVSPAFSIIQTSPMNFSVWYNTELTKANCFSLQKFRSVLVRGTCFLVNRDWSGNYPFRSQRYIANTLPDKCAGPLFSILFVIRPSWFILSFENLWQIKLYSLKYLFISSATFCSKTY